MKTLLENILLVLFFTTLTSGAIAQQKSPQLLFDEANQLLQKGKIVQALDHYRRITETGQVSGGLFINMGYAFMQLGKLGKAKYYFLKAKQFETTRKKALSGLQTVNAKLKHQSVVLPPLPVEKALNWLQTNIGRTLLLAIGLILLNIGVFIFIFIGLWFTPKKMNLWRKTSVAVAAGGVLIVILSFYISYRQQRYSKAVMINRVAKVMKEPAPSAVIKNKAYEGYTFTIDHQKSQGHEHWVYVQMANGTHGWIRRKEIMIL